MKPNQSRLLINCFSVFLVMLGLYFGWNTVMLHFGEFSPDSFSYYDIAQTIGKDFGRVSTIRQYVLRSDYNCSFPYLYPLCIRLTDLLTGAGAAAGIWFDLALMPLTALLFMRISCCFTQDYFCGAAASFLTFLNPAYLQEVYAARSIPLSILLTAAAVYTAIRLYQEQYRKKLCVVLLGFLAGLNWMNRFDEISLAAFLVPVLLLTAPKQKRLQTVLLYTAGLLPVCLPWFIYSWVHFRTFCISDNNGTMMLVKPEVPSYVFLPDAENMSLRTAPGKWLSSRLDIAGKTLSAVFSDAVSALPVPLILAACGLAGCVRKYGRKMNAGDLKSLLPSRKAFRIIGVILLYTAAKLMMYILVGYVEHRYYAELLAMLLFSLTVCIVLTFRDLFPAFTLPSLIAGAFLVLIQTMIPDCLMPMPVSDFPDLHEKYAWMDELESAMQKQAAPGDSVLLAGYELNGFMYGAVTGRHTYVSPENPTAETLDYVTAQLADAQWIVLSVKQADGLREALASQYPETVFPEFYLYHITEKGN